MAAARDVVHALADAGLTVATGESLTAGLVAARLADVPGASAVLHGGVVAYQNAVKTGLLGVPEDLLARVGAVDADVARRMALGARAALGADVGVATTGVAGPEPHQGQPVGTVWLGLAVPDADASALDVFGGERDGAATAILLRLDGDRAAIREATVAAALQALTRLLAGRGH
ncbi:nicotinamide-nucleotide amidohydrolase family protein [Micrococcus luteus]|nr:MULTISPECIES: nicotinamide-nucleotide amidohydrolase family protein [Micrococcus]MBU8762229.1 nicotinamide-nucleotide amidohydrolase family protein [Micrococcus luteus]MBY0173427.1 nicotinamide-nucleotide amidohydrolase family protein [Micrococcus luteus]MCD0172566.1 nicotinamide-nucleotide amidohydrolase family protein [Micrococcus luteus]MCD0178797.1 nicotinamide-nucleotide amidohydrolase family protein [Micrococcus luteus]MCF8559327.1 nicotinamide-nucleotide amidohydrolase family protein